MLHGSETDAALKWFSRKGQEPAIDLSLEELLLGREGAPLLLTYRWAGPVLVLGYAQRASEGVDLPFCREAGIPVLRRITGGTGVLHTGDLAVSLLLPSRHPWTGGIRSLYGRFLGAFQEALSGLGVETARAAPPQSPPARRSPICFEDQLTESLLLGGKKVLGCAQARRSNGVLVHATVLTSLDTHLQSRVYGVPSERISAAMVPLPGIGSSTAEAAVASSLAASLGLPLVPAAPSPEVLAEAGLLAETRYNLTRWKPT